MTTPEMMEALQALAAEKGMTTEVLLEAVANGLESAYKRMPDAADDAYVVIDEMFNISVIAQEIDEEGNIVQEWDDTPENFGRIAAQTARQVLTQRIREVERDMKYEEYAGREGDIVTGIIQQTDSRYTLLDLGRVEALLPQSEQVPYERPEPNSRLKAYIVEVRKTAKGPQIVVSRTHPGLIRELFKLEVPEISDGIVEMKACAREPGHRTKIAVWSNDTNIDPVGACVGARGARVRQVVNELRGEKIDIVPFSDDQHDLPNSSSANTNIDPVGACVGARGARVRQVVNELRGEKIDIVPFSDDQHDFVAKALSPAKVREVRFHEVEGVAEVVVPDHQLSLAIGREGQNARLAARLTGWRIDIKSETQIVEEETAYADGDWAEGEWVTDPETGEQTWVPADGSEAMSADDWATAAEEIATEDINGAPDSADMADQEDPTELAADDESSQEQEEQPTN